MIIPPIGLCLSGHEPGKNVPDNGNTLTCSDFGVRDNFSLSFRPMCLNLFSLLPAQGVILNFFFSQPPSAIKC